MHSIWTKTCKIPPRERLQGNTETEVAVIGAGLAGILTAWLLQEAGKQVVVLEAGRIAGGQTGNTTAKITSQHGLIYQDLIRLFGEEKAGQYAGANEAALEEYRRIIETERIDCDFEEKSAYYYSDREERIEKEAAAAIRLGLPASFVREVPLPGVSACAVCFAHQAQFHPLKLIKALSEKLRIYEQTTAVRVEDHRVITENGHIRAEKVVFACHYPFINFPGFYFARLHQERSYVLALENAVQVDGMFLGEGKYPYSFRNYGELLLFGGEKHRTGENREGGRYQALREKAKELYPDSREVCFWSAQDCITPDRVPYIGSFSSGKPDWYVATGFQKWGMTSSMVSAMLIRDEICGAENSRAGIFRQGRFRMKNLAGIAGEGGQAVKGHLKRYFQFPKEKAGEIPAGHGGIVRLNGKKAGVYKDPEGMLYAVDIRCPHLGCQLEWNPDELSWDCPCHGSRFDFTGRLINNPAQTPISHQK